MVFVERIIDFNGNGEIDPGENISIRSFYVTDGFQTIIGGIRNTNVPADEDGATNGTIDLRLDFVGVSSIFNRQPGKYVIRATTGSGQSQQPFEVTARAFPQKIAGTVLNSANHSPIPFAFLVILVGDGEPIGSVRADASGGYEVQAAPGNYSLIPFSDGFSGGLNAVVLPAGQSIATNLTLNPATIRVAGHIGDSIIGGDLPGIFVLAEGATAFSGGFTDRNGDYSLAVTPGPCDVIPLSDVAAEFGYLVPGNNPGIDATIGSGPFNRNFFLTKATSLIYGKITEVGNGSLSGLRLNAHLDDQVRLESAGRTGPTGDYVLGATDGPWNLMVEDTATLGYASAQNQLTMQSGSAIRSDFTLRKITAHLRGKVVDARGVGIQYARVQGQFGSDYNAAQDETDAEGNFDLPVYAGSWTFHIGNAEDYSLIDRFVNIVFVDGVDQTLTITVPDPTGHITGNIQTPDNNVFLQVIAEATIGGVQFKTSVFVSGGEPYSLPAINGVWNVSINCEHPGMIENGLRCPPTQQVTVNGNDVIANFNTIPIASPMIENPSINRSIVPAQFQFVLKGSPGTYDILGAPSLPDGWTVSTAVTISPGNQTTLVQFNPGANRFFKARLQ